MDNYERLLRLPEVMKKTGLGKTLIYEMMADGRLPSAIAITPRAVRWAESEVSDWVRVQIYKKRLYPSPAKVREPS